MRILITGANGFLGYYLVEKLLQKKMEVYATGRGDCRLPFIGDTNFTYFNLDFTELIEVKKVFEDVQPEIIVHAGAMSKPDDCEINKPEAFRTNVEGTINLLQAAEKYKCFFIFLSTDFVFDGINGMYSENDTPGPVNYYGLSKLLAEKEVKAYKNGWAIVRTVLVYGKPTTGKKNLLTIIKEKLENGEEYKVVSDQIRTPTYVEDLAAGIVSIVEKKAEGVFHISGEDILTPYDMACKTADFLKLDKTLLKQANADNFNQPARRPLKTGFIIEKAKKVLGFNPISFEEGLKKTFG
jgi:dTDP-4-dehydrorhamnose reductase